MTEFAPLVANPDNAFAVEVSVSSIDRDGIRLTVRRYADDEILGTDLTPAEIFQNLNWIVAGVTHITDAALDTVIFTDPRKPFDDLTALLAELTKLRAEEFMSNGERYRNLTGPHGLVQLTEARAKVLRLVAQFAIRVQTGMWPFELDRLGL